MFFKKAIVRRPPKSFPLAYQGAPDHAAPDYDLAIQQHDAYIAALEECGCEVTVLPPVEHLIKSVFVEDPVVITPKGAIITNPGLAIRNPEKDAILPTIKELFDDEHIAYIELPGTLEGGDVMMVEDHFYVGKSNRTNQMGVDQFIKILADWGIKCEEVPLTTVLHLKTGANYLDNNRMIVSGEFIDKPIFDSYDKIIVPDEEMNAANCLWVNETIIVPKGYPTMLEAMQNLGYKTIVVDISEYEKLNGGLSCLSVRF